MRWYPDVLYYSTVAADFNGIQLNTVPHNSICCIKINVELVAVVKCTYNVAPVSEAMPLHCGTDSNSTCRYSRTNVVRHGLKADFLLSQKPLAAASQVIASWQSN